jgi:hypothetical protein
VTRHNVTVADIAAVGVLACRSAEMRAAAPQNEPIGRGSSTDCVVHVVQQVYGAQAKYDRECDGDKDEDDPPPYDGDDR